MNIKLENTTITLRGETQAEELQLTFLISELERTNANFFVNRGYNKGEIILDLPLRDE